MKTLKALLRYMLPFFVGYAVTMYAYKKIHERSSIPPCSVYYE